MKRRRGSQSIPSSISRGELVDRLARIVDRTPQQLHLEPWYELLKRMADWWKPGPKNRRTFREGLHPDSTEPLTLICLDSVAERSTDDQCTVSRQYGTVYDYIREWQERFAADAADHDPPCALVVKGSTTKRTFSIYTTADVMPEAPPDGTYASQLDSYNALAGWVRKRKVVEALFLEYSGDDASKLVDAVLSVANRPAGTSKIVTVYVHEPDTAVSPDQSGRIRDTLAFLPKRYKPRAKLPPATLHTRIYDLPPSLKAALLIEHIEDDIIEGALSIGWYVHGSLDGEVTLDAREVPGIVVTSGADRERFDLYATLIRSVARECAACLSRPDITLQIPLKSPEDWKVANAAVRTVLSATPALLAGQAVQTSPTDRR